MVDLGTGLLTALLSGGGSYLAKKQQQEALERERQQQQTSDFIKMVSGGFMPFQPESMPTQTPADFMKSGQLKAPTMGAIPQDVLRTPQAIGGTNLWRQQPESKDQTLTPASFMKFFKPLSGKLEPGESPPVGAIPAPEYMKKIFPDVDYYMYQSPVNIDFSSLIGGQ